MSLINSKNQKKFYVNPYMWFVIFFVFFYMLYVLRSVLMPFVAGILLAYLLDPMVDRLQKLKFSRTWATLIVCFLTILIVMPCISLLVSMIENQVSLLVQATPKYLSLIMEKLKPTLQNITERFPDLKGANIEELIKANIGNGMKVAGRILRSLMSNGFALINLISLLLIMPVVTFYMLRDWDDFVKKFESLLPKKSKKGIIEGFKEIDKIIAGFIRGQLSVCLILGLFYSIGLKLVGLELGLLVGFIAGIISFIPYVGSITGFILGCVLAFAQYGDITHVLYVIAVFMLGQFIEGNFLTPKLVGESVGLHPVWVMFALLAGGVLLGFLGLMLAVPLAAIIGVLVRYGIKRYKQSSLYLD
ncbi:MAG: AI-2E family transporter [Alphaproteobacteria bacterium]|nr:AI-2E family transporter [Alphaproteobacteria bacterium]